MAHSPPTAYIGVVAQRLERLPPHCNPARLVLGAGARRPNPTCPQPMHGNLFTTTLASTLEPRTPKYSQHPIPIEVPSPRTQPWQRGRAYGLHPLPSNVCLTQLCRGGYSRPESPRRWGKVAPQSGLSPQCRAGCETAPWAYGQTGCAQRGEAAVWASQRKAARGETASGQTLPDHSCAPGGHTREGSGWDEMEPGRRP